jgi:hypothetical protein
VSSVISNIPIFLEFRSTHDTETQLKRIEYTDLRIDKNYIIFFKNGFEGIILMILPFVTMVYINANIVYTLRARATRRLHTMGSQTQIKNEMNLATVLVTMDVVFLICNIGRVLVNIWEIFHIGQVKECLDMDLPYKVKSILRANF